MRKMIIILNILLTASAFSETKDEIVNYVLENEVGIHELPSRFGVTPFSLIGSPLLDDFGIPKSFGDTESPARAMVLMGDLSLMLVDCWSNLVVLQGSAEDLGLSRERVNDIFDLRMFYNAKNLPKCGEEANGPRRRSIYFTITVWTVGKEYPIAYFIEYENFISPEIEGGRNKIFFGGRLMGVTNSLSVRSKVKESIDTTTEDFGIRMMRVERNREGVE